MGMRAGICWALMMLGMALGAPALAEPRPFELRGGQVVITVTLNGREVPALLDTGATKSLIERGLARELGIRSQTTRSGGTIGAAGKRVDLGFTSPVKLDIGAGAATQRIGTYPAGNAFADDDVRLLIGMDLLSAMVVSLDFQKMTVEFQRSSQFAPHAVGEPLKLTPSGWRRPTLPVSLAGAQANLLFDTAASGALHLDSAFVSATPALKSLPVSQRVITGIDGVHEHDAIVVPHMTFGGQTFERVSASSGSFGRLRAADDMDGVVGVDLLKRFNLVIDFGRHRVWMTPNADRND
jgi:hypothetical protein